MRYAFVVVGEGADFEVIVPSPPASAQAVRASRASHATGSSRLQCRFRMPFEAGTRLGPYEIVALLGAGGMGEVYRARDTRLDRIVAVKVLTDALAADSEARQRFEHEARAIAALNDPHICTIHDVGRHGGLDYLVLEYLEGETLATRLRHAPPLSIDDAIAVAIQIGDALDRAHHVGLVHRDLKPGNVMLVRRSGASGGPDVKLLDFGLAARTAVERPQATVSLAETIAASMTETRLATPTTGGGFSGTVQYMSPEQFGGDTGDQRSDIFAFGWVLYEMLAGGRKAFEGANVLAVMAAVSHSDPPPIPALQPAHALLDHMLRRCLEKDREHRWQSIRDVTGMLRWIVDQPQASLAAGVAATSASAATAPPPRGIRVMQLVPYAIALAIGIVATLAVLQTFAGHETSAAAEAPTLRFEIPTAATDDPSVALSPDGRLVAFVANQRRVPMIWIRALDAVEPRVLAGTEGASFPFWSPDGHTVGFFAEDKLKRIDINTGGPLALADAPNARGGAWNADGVILFAPGITGPIMRVSTRGGPAERVTQVDAGIGPAHRAPQFLPDGKRFLFSSALGSADTNGVYIGSIDKTPPIRILANDGGGGRFVPPETLLTTRQGALQAYRFNVAAGTVQGEPIVLAQGFTGAAAAAAFSGAGSGVLAWRGGTMQRRQLTWVNRQGIVLGTIGEPHVDLIASPELSPDEQSVAVFLQRNGDNDIWTIELARNLAHRLTNGPPADAHPLWDPDGQHIVFNTQRFGGSSARVAIGGGAAEPLPLLPKGERGEVLAWTRDRQFVLLRRRSPRGDQDLLAVSTSGAPREIVVAQSPSEETEGQFSADGRWVAFASNENGRSEVFAQSFPEARARIQVSTAGGAQVRWSADGKEIYYVAPDGMMTAVSIALGDAKAEVKAPMPLFPTYLASGINVLGNKPQYAVSRDGRFLLNTAIESDSSPIIVSTNFRPFARSSQAR
jgi:serine/threonine protein kinase/Tol biopolymer transport system component